MLEGLPDEEVDRYLEEHPKIVPLFEVDITKAIGPYTCNESRKGIRRTRSRSDSGVALGARIVGKRNDYIATGKSFPAGEDGPRN